MLLKGVSMKFKMSNVTTSQYSSITREMVLSRTTCPHMTKLDLKYRESIEDSYKYHLVNTQDHDNHNTLCDLNRPLLYPESTIHSQANFNYVIFLGIAQQLFNSIVPKFQL